MNHHKVMNLYGGKINLHDYKVKIVTRSMCDDLYHISQSSIFLPFERIRLELKTAEGYLYEILQSDADYIINIDEDAFIIDNCILEELVEYCIINEIDVCGFPDGGVLPIRMHNPLVANPFFNIFHTKKIKNYFSYRVIHSYCEHKKEYEKNTPFHLIRSPYSYDCFEPYYPFFIWLSQNFIVLYLNGETHEDGISTILKDHNGNPFLIHTWYAREYRKNEYHTNRINRIIDSINVSNLI